MLTKAHARKLDWALQIPFALFALRQMPHRDTLLSPFELVFCHNVRTPLELLYGEWSGGASLKLDVSTWVGQLQERLELARETARQRSVKAVKDRKERCDRGSCVRQFELDNLVWCRIPGMDCKLGRVHGRW